MPVRKKALWEAFCNIVTAFIYLSFIVVFTQAFINRHEVSVLLFAIFDTVVVFFLFLRGMPKSTSTNPVYWAAAMGGSWASLLLRPAALVPGTSFFLIPQIAGILISFAGLFSLNKSFGLMASNRGIRTTGMYRHIRHPLYAGYILTNVSFMIQHFSVWNLGIAVFHAGMEIWRIFIEEKFLSADPAYVELMKTTKWRLIPRVW